MPYSMTISDLNGPGYKLMRSDFDIRYETVN